MQNMIDQKSGFSRVGYPLHATKRDMKGKVGSSQKDQKARHSNFSRGFSRNEANIRPDHPLSALTWLQPVEPAIDGKRNFVEALAALAIGRRIIAGEFPTANCIS